MTDLRQHFIEGMSRASTFVSVITTDGEAGRFGVTVSSMTSLSADGAALNAEKASSYYIGAGTLFMKLIVPVDANNSKRDWTVLDICALDNCGQPSVVR